jgi:2-oxoglutarate dehydrogenase E2 component (dihydrolipoamide succinyltransferase)
VLVRRLHQEGDVVGVGATLGEFDDAPVAVHVEAAPMAAETTAAAVGAEELVTATEDRVTTDLAVEEELAVAAPTPPSVAHVPEEAQAPAPPAEPESELATPAEWDQYLRTSPAARRLAGESGVDLREVAGTGLGGVVSKPDVVEYLEQRGEATETIPAPGTPEVEVVRPEPPREPTPLEPLPPREPEAPPEAPPPVEEPREEAAPSFAAGETAAAAPAPEVPFVAEEEAAEQPPIPQPVAEAPVTAAPVAEAPLVEPVVAPEPAAAPVVPPPEPAPPPAEPVPAPAAARETRERMSTRRRRIAEHLLEAQHATAHLTTFNEIDMSAVEALRARIRERVEKEHGVRLSFIPFFVRAACQALRQFPVVNARIDGDHIVYHHYVNMGIAVASEAGLVVPNVRDADRKGLLQVAREIAAVAKTARDGKLTMDDLTGGTFTITNGGVFGSMLSTPIINYPQVAILGLHKIQDRPMAIDGKVEIRPMMYVALSYDHRIIDGQQAVLFLVRVKELLEDPALMLVD